MKVVVVDASIAAKWFLPEPDAAAAIRLMDGRRRLAAPDLIRPEMANILWKLHARNLLSSDEASEIIGHFLSIPLEIYESASLLPGALEIAMATQRTVYDSLHLSLAVQLNAKVITADRRWVNALQTGPFAPFIRLLTAGAE
jgi:predicted nucleic acid-binding protein